MAHAKTTARQRRPREEAIRMGKVIYRETVLPQVERDHHGEYVAIDVDSKQWAIAGTTRAAVEGLRAQCPDAVNILCERVGYRALYSFGGGSHRRVE